MIEKKYKLTYLINKDVQEKIVTSEQLIKCVKNYIKMDYEVLCITIDPKYIKKIRKIKEEKRLKDKYYNSKYSQLHTLYKSSKLDEQQYITILNKLKEMKNKYKTRNQFEKNFEQYKKANNIPPYNASL